MTPLSKISPGVVRETRGAIHYAHLVLLLMTEGGTQAQLAEKTGFSLPTIRRHLRAFRNLRDTNGRRIRLVRICDWDEDKKGNLTRPVYKLEPGLDVKRPRITDAERQRRYRANRAKRDLVGTPCVFAYGETHAQAVQEAQAAC